MSDVGPVSYPFSTEFLERKSGTKRPIFDLQISVFLPFVDILLDDEDKQRLFLEECKAFKHFIDTHRIKKASHDHCIELEDILTKPLAHLINKHHYHHNTSIALISFLVIMFGLIGSWAPT